MDDAKFKELQLNRWAIAQLDPWYFLKYFVNTIDEHDRTENAISKPFPAKAMYRVITRAWGEHDELYIEKSRQVMMTWIMCALFLHDAMFHKARRIFFQSKKDEDAQAVLDRARHIYVECFQMGLPGLPKVKMTGEKFGTDAVLEWPSQKSLIMAIPQGGHIVRSHTPSGLFSDEMNHQPEFPDAQAAAAACCQKFIAQGTPNGRAGGFRFLYGINTVTGKPDGENKVDSALVKDRIFDIPKSFSPEERRLSVEKALLDMSDDDFRSIPIEVLVANTPGMKYWVTSQGTPCLSVHYTADPDKDPKTERGTKWYAMARRKQKSEQMWQQEMEIRYDVFVGRPVIANWSRDRFVGKPVYTPRHPIRLSFDLGTQVCVTTFSQLIPIQEYPGFKQLRYLAEIMLQRSNTVDQMRATIRLLNQYFPESLKTMMVEAFCDPNADIQYANTSDKSQASNLAIIESFGIQPSNVKFGVPESTQIMETAFSLSLPNGEPAIVIHERCEYLISVIGGGLHYPEEGKGREGHYVKDGYYDHGGDAMRYDIANAFDEETIMGERSVHQPTSRVIRDPVTGRIVGRQRIGQSKLSRGHHPLYGR